MNDVPLIAIATDIAEPRPGRPRAECGLAYAEAVARAGGMPVFLAAVPELIPGQLQMFDGFVLTGGDDPSMEEFGVATHPAAKPVHARRQAYEVALIRALLVRPEVPVLGICLGMQMLALVGGGTLDQHLPDWLATSDDHRDNAEHRVCPESGSGLAEGVVASSHRQAVSDAGPFRVAARSHDGVIEAIDDPRRPFCLGVQWHPERTRDAALGDGVFSRFVEAARVYRATRMGGR